MYRIVHNEQTDSYRIEKRGLLGWNFVNDRHGDGYLELADFDAARAWVCRRQRTRNDGRRWKIVTDCDF